MSEWTITELLRQMCEQGASDLLLTAGVSPQIRVQGLLKPVGNVPLTADDTRRIAYSLLNDPEVEVLTRRRSLDFSRGFEGLSRFRFNLFYQRDSVAMAARIIPFSIPPFEELSLPDIVKDFASRPNGLVLITGPAGSGKSTTLAAMIDYINHTRHVHIVCIEDPVEYLHTHHKSVIAQREIGEDSPSFADALRNVFRQSPDVIMIGELRDLETIQLALTLAETGHLILATLHTQDTTHAINRIVDVFPAGQQDQIYVQLALVLQGVVTQQLIPTTDGKRRLMACEVMNVNNAIRNLIRERELQQIYSVIQTGRKDGMFTMNDSIRAMCLQGLIDEDTAVRRSPRPSEMVQLLSRRNTGKGGTQ